MEKTLILGKIEEIEGRTRSGQQDEMDDWHPRLSGQEFEQTSGDKWKTEELGVLQSIAWQRVGYNIVTEQRQLASSSQ